MANAPDGAVVSAPSRYPAYGVLRKVTSAASVLLAENPSSMTLAGTNTWVLRAPGSPGCVVVDPGPADEAHLRRLADNGPIALVLLTHGHPDHADGVARLHDMVGAPVLAADRGMGSGGAGLRDGEVVSAAGLDIRVLSTPGHTADSLCFLIEDDDGRAILTGDTVLGAGTTVVAHPDGTLRQYLDSLRGLVDLPPNTAVLPGHGPEHADIATLAASYLDHRRARLAQVRSALDRLGPAATPRTVVEYVYQDVDHSLWPAAELSVCAQLEYLRESR